MKRILLMVAIAIGIVSCNTKEVVKPNGETIKQPILLTEAEGARVYYIIANGRTIYFGVTTNANHTVSVAVP